MRRSTIFVALILGALLVWTAAAPALGAGFEVAEKAGRQLGNAYSGKAAEADDATTVYFNPAGMTRLGPGIHVAAAFELLWTGGRFADQGSMNRVTQMPLTGNNGGSPGGPSYLPNLYLAVDLPEGFSAGLGINVPFGLTTEYGEGWVGRYHALKSELAAINVNPNVAYRINEQFSIGAGVNYSMAEAELTNAVDFGSIVAGSGQYTPQQLGALGIAPERNDGKAIVDSDVDDAWGFNVGILFELSESTRFGLAYRSSIDHELRGDATFEVPASITASGFPAATGLFMDTKGTAKITLPDQVFLSAYHEIDDEWAILGDVTWTRWSHFDELRVDFDNPAQPDSAHEEDWEDVFRFALGAIYRPDPDWTVRFGVAYDQSPVQDDHRTPRIPTNDRFWISAGIGYQVSSCTAIDLAYTRIIIQEGEIDQTTATGQRLKGEFRGYADIFGIQITTSF